MVIFRLYLQEILAEEKLHIFNLFWMQEELYDFFEFIRI